MSESRSAAFTVTATLATVGILARSFGGGGTAPAEAPPAATAPAAEPKKDGPPLVPPGRYADMGSRLLAVSMGDTAWVPREMTADSVGILIATIPDPVDSHEDWAYDSYLEAIRRAHEQEKYSVARMWLPWATGTDSVLDEPHRTRLRQAFPGVLVFRSSDTAAATADRPLYRIVYLVGEVPTAGVHPLALTEALRQRDLILGRHPGAPLPAPPGGAKNKEGVDMLHVLGPTFSGSAPGLATLLDRWRMADPQRQVHIVTGSATASSNTAAFDPARGYEFAATVNSDGALRRELSTTVLPRLGVADRELAILVEGSTAYGRGWEGGAGPATGALGAAAAEKSVANKGAAAHRDRAAAAAAPATQGDRPAVLDTALTLSFPMNIATLRDEYADRLRAMRRTQQEPSSAPSLSLTDGSRPMETPPVASRLTAAAVDLTLEEIAATLRSHDIRAVAIAASDVRDRLFLVSELRRRLRDVQFIVLESNSLYLSPEYNRDLQGMLVLSSYPLVTETQLWTDTRQLVPFSNEYAEGMYNAALVHLHSPDLVDYGYPDASGRARRPPVWVTVVGGGALLPLRVDMADSGYTYVAKGGKPPLAKPDPRFDFLSGVLLFAILAVAGWLLHAALLQAARLKETWLRDRGLFREQVITLKPLFRIERAARRRRLTRDERRELRPFTGPYLAAAPAEATPAPAVYRGDLTAGEAAALASVAGGGAADRRTLLLSRCAEWGSLRIQEALYRFVFCAAVLGGLVPGTVLIATSTWQSHPSLSWAWTAAAAVALAVFAAVAGWATLRVDERGHMSKRAVVACAGAAAVAGVTLLAAVLTSDSRVAAMAVITAAAALQVLLAGLVLACSSLVRWSLWYRRILRACRVRRHPRVDLWRLNVYARRLVLGLSAAYVVLIALFAGEVALSAGHDRVRFTLLFQRAWRLDGGMSPIIPLGLAALAFAAWARWHLRRIRALRQVTAFEAACLAIDAVAPVVPASAEDEAVAPEEWSLAIPRRAVEGVRQVRDRLTRLVPDGGAAVLFLVLMLCCGCIAVTRYRSMEHLAGFRLFDWIYRFGLVGMVVATAWAVYRLLAVWTGLCRTLRAIAGTPLVTAFERLPRRVARLTRLVFLGTPRRAVVAPVAAAQWRHLRGVSAAIRGKQVPALKLFSAADLAPVAAVGAVEDGDEGGAAARASVASTVGEAREEASSAFAGDASEEGEGDAPAGVQSQEDRLRAMLLAYAELDQPDPGLGRWGEEGARGENLLRLAAVLQEFWKCEPRGSEITGVQEQVEKHGASSEPGPSTSGRFRRTAGDEMALWFRAAEEFAAVQVVDYIESVINQMRVLALFIFVSLLLVTLHEGAYPYQPQSLLKLILFGLLASTVGTMVKLMIEMNRDELLSRIAKTEPGKVTWDMHFVLNLAVFAVVPFVSLVGSEFPAVRDFLLAWIYPLTRLVGGG